MKTGMTIPAILAALCLLANGVVAQESGDRYQQENSKQPAETTEITGDEPIVEEKEETSNTRASVENKVTNFNKVTKLVGMEVINHRNEVLGDIQDIVVDLKSGKISYVVLSVGGFLGVGEKYIAVPANAFSTAEPKGKLVLHTDKSSVEAASGFIKTEWPDVKNPDWGAAGGWVEPELEEKVEAPEIPDLDDTSELDEAADPDEIE